MKEQELGNISLSVYVDDKKVGEIIHYETKGRIESWHYQDSSTTQLCVFSERFIKESLLFAKYGSKWAEQGE